MSQNSISKFISCVNQACKKNSIYTVLEFSRINLSLVQLIYRNGLLTHYHINSFFNTSKRRVIKSITLYFKIGYSYNTIRTINHISKPGRRIYVTKQNVFHKFGKYNFAILSTSMGFFTINEARQLGIGGELLMEIDC